MTTRLKLYNAALFICEQRSIASLSVNEEARHVLDEIWNNDAVRYCLEQGQWKFALRGSRFDYNPSIEPEWGYSRAFTKPEDWVITSAVSLDERFNTPLTEYADEVGNWFCDSDELFVKYVSSADTYGFDLARWPQTFADYVAAHLAWRAVPRMPGGQDKKEGVEHDMKKAKITAKNKDAMAGPTTFPARGTWTLSRWGNRMTRRDGGSRSGNLIG